MRCDGCDETCSDCLSRYSLPCLTFISEGLDFDRFHQHWERRPIIKFKWITPTFIIIKIESVHPLTPGLSSGIKKRPGINLAVISTTDLQTPPEQRSRGRRKPHRRNPKPNQRGEDSVKVVRGIIILLGLWAISLGDNQWRSS